MEILTRHLFIQNCHQSGRAGECSADKLRRGDHLQGSQVYWFDYWQDLNVYKLNISSTSGQLLVKPNTNFIGNTGHYIVVSTNSQWNLYYYYGLSLPPYDLQLYTFAFGDTVISAVPTNFTATALMPFTNLLLATFTNGRAEQRNQQLYRVHQLGRQLNNGG